jgi:predicted esterase
MKLATALTLATVFASCAHGRPTAVQSERLGCAPGYEAIEGNACLALPRVATAQTSVILFFHGMYSADFPEAEFAIEERIASAAGEQGFAVLAPRGEIGLCNWSADVARFVCWPTTEAQRPKVGEIVVGLRVPFRETSARLKVARIVPWVLGYSNGGYFASDFLSETRMSIRGAAIVNGGPVEPAHFASDRAVPTLLIAAEDDPFQKPKMDRLHQLLDSAGWRHQFTTRPEGHALSDRDIHTTLQFFLDHTPP